jgi:Cu(I)/Ag(I) efflux system membrane fusion protein
MDADPRPAPDAPLSRRERFHLIFKVVELRLRFIALMAVTGAVFAYWDTIWNHVDKWRRPASEIATAAAPGVEFFCPMHPAVVMEQPALCPICGMPLSKRAKGETPTLPPGVAARVALSPLRVAQAGVRTVPVAYAPIVEEVTSVGTVELDESRVRRIASRLPGMTRIESLRVNVTGQPIRAGEILGTLYSASLYQAAQELLVAARAAAKPTPASGSLARQVLGDGDALLRASAEKLKLWGLTQQQIDEIVQSGRADYRVPVVAPIDGVVIAKRVVEGQYLAEGETMFEVADLRHLWIKARLYENQMALAEPGQEVQATVAAFPGETFRGTVALIDPILDPATRTVGVRFDLDNADLRLRPGMYATVTLTTPVARTPAYLARHPEPTADDLPLALTPEAQKVCLVTSLQLGAMGEPVPIDVDGRKVWLCCAGCEDKIRATPATYLSRLEAAPRDQVLTVPESAVIDTGRRTLVYVEAEPGVFEARDVTLGARSGDLFPVLDGLMPGEQVAAAGAFLIDAETRLSAGGASPYADPPAARVAHQH